MMQGPLVLDHVLNADHDTITHSTLFPAIEGNLFCVHCAAARYKNAPDFRRLALLDGVGNILRAYGPQSLRDCVDECMPMLLHGVSAADSAIAQSATDILLALRAELSDVVGTLASLVSRIISLGLPRASNHLFAVGQLLSDASQDQALAATLTGACITYTQSGGEAPCCRVDESLSPFRSFASFLAAHVSSLSLLDQVKSDVIYVTLELLDCILATGTKAGLGMAQDPPVNQGPSEEILALAPPGEDPFVEILLAIPRTLARKSSCDEALQLHSVAYIATATAYCRERTALGVPGWSTNNTAGVADVLAALLDGGDDGGGKSFNSEAALLEVPLGPTYVSGGLCNTIKSLLMSSSYRVREATARLIRTVCDGDEPLVEDILRNEADSFVDAKQSSSSYFREKLVAAGTSDYLFEAIKREREGTIHHYLEAAEALSLSTIEFFHSRNFSIKFAAPILLAAARGDYQNVSSMNEEGFGRGEVDSMATDGVCGDHDAESSFASASRLLLRALIAVPSTSIGGVVEELLAAAIGHQPANGAIRSIAVAADVLSLLTSGDIPLPKYLRTLARRQDPSALLDSLVILTRRLEDVLLVTSRLTATAEPSLMLSMAPSSAVEGIWQASNNMDSLFVQASRAMENLLHMVEVWALGGHPELNQMRRNNRGADGTSDEGNFLAEIVFTSSERMLGCMCTMASRSESVAQGVAFISCTGAAMDSAATVLSCHEAPTSMMATSTSNGTSGGICNFPFLPMNWGPDPVPHHSNLPRCGSSKEQLVSEGSSRRGTKRTIAVRDLAIDDHNEHCSGTVAAASCLQSTLEMARASDLVAWLLNLYSQCGGGDNRLSSSAKEAGHREGQFRHDRSAEWPSGIAGAGHVAAPGMVAGCSFKTRELFVEVLETLLFAQGWINCLSSHDADRPLHSQRVSTNQIEVRHGSRDEIAQTNTESANLPGTLRLVLSSWAARREKELSLDHFVISLLGTDADNGYLCKLVLLLMSLSPCYLGILYPREECRVDAAVKILNFVKTVPEAVFCLNLIAHVVGISAESRERGDGTRFRVGSEELATAITHVLVRFPVEDLASAKIPLSTGMVSIATCGGCASFLADWLVAAPLARIRRVFQTLGILHEREGGAPFNAATEASVQDISNLVSWRQDESEPERETGLDEAVLSGLLEAAVFRWQKELETENDLQWMCMEATISRLSTVLMMASNTFFNVLFETKSEGARIIVRDARNSATLTSLEFIIPDTLARIASRGVARTPSAFKDTQHPPGISCMPQVLQLASALLRARCEHGIYSPGGSRTRLQRRRDFVPPSSWAIEITLAHACVDFLQGELYARGSDEFSSANALEGNVLEVPTRVLVVNLLTSLLLVQEEIDILEEKDGISRALNEVGMALSNGTTLNAAEALRKGLERAPRTVAAYLQLCAIWNCSSLSRPTGSRGTPRELLDFPFEPLQEVFALASMRTVPFALVVSAARYIESAAPSRPFSRTQVQSLQLALQSIACDGTASEAVASLRAITALWETYSGDLPSSELAGQPWNSFVLERCLENACWLLIREAERGVNSRSESTEGSKFMESPAVPIAAAAVDGSRSASSSMVISAVCILAHRCLEADYPQLRSSGSMGVVSAASMMFAGRCLTFLADDLCQVPGDEIRANSTSAAHQGIRGDDTRCKSAQAGPHRWEAVGHLVRLLLRITPPKGVEEESDAETVHLRRVTANVLSRLRDRITSCSELCDGETSNHRGDGADTDGETAKSSLHITSMLSRGTYYHDMGLLVVTHNLWRTLSSSASPDSDHAQSARRLRSEIAQDIHLLSSRMLTQEATPDPCVPANISNAAEVKSGGGH